MLRSLLFVSFHMVASLIAVLVITAWQCVPWEMEDVRQQLTQHFHTPLKKAYEGPSVVVLEGDATRSVLTRDAEPCITRTHCDTGEDFPWQVSGAENCCAVATTCIMCTIL